MDQSLAESAHSRSGDAVPRCGDGRGREHQRWTGHRYPIRIVGRTWINAKELAGYLNKRKIQGVRFMPVDFRPGANRYQGELCHGVQIVLTDRQALDAGILGVEIASALYRLYPNDFPLDKTLANIGARWVIEAIQEQSGSGRYRLGVAGYA